MQPSFASGEISPLLHARVDLARYGTGLAELKNMVVLPQGGVTRRGGSEFLSTNNPSVPAYPVPFEFSSGDSLVLWFYGVYFEVWRGSTYITKVKSNLLFSSMLSTKRAQYTRWVQSGNVLFMTHRDYPPILVRRGDSDEEWTVERLDPDGGPWIDGGDLAPGSQVKIDFETPTHLYAYSGEPFRSWMVGSKVRLEYSISGGSQEEAVPEGETRQMEFEVGSSLNVRTTSGDAWAGTVKVERKTGRSGNWLMVREFTRTNTDKEGQIDFTVAETEKDIFYRVTGICTSGGFDLSASSDAFVRGFIFRITGYLDPKNVWASWERSEDEGELPETSLKATYLGWQLMAWGSERGYPWCCEFYQDRLVLAGSYFQPGSIWMSRVGSYRDFSVSDPVKDDDAINISLTSRTADGIHSLLAVGGDLLAFTAAEEWRVSGAGDSGAITPTAVVAHRQSSIGSRYIQPLDVGGRVVMVQTQGKKVYALGYDLNTDGYRGNEISILSPHLLESGVEFMAWQKTPHGILWFALSNGAMVSCTFSPEHEVVGWSRHEMDLRFSFLAAFEGDGQTEIWGMAQVRWDGAWRGTYLARLRAIGSSPCTDETGHPAYHENTAYESVIRTLRVTADGEGGSAFPAKKLISRLTVMAIGSTEAWVAPAGDWERRRKLTWDGGSGISDAEVQLDNGFASDAAIEIRTSDPEGPLTVAAIAPVLTVGG